MIFYIVIGALKLGKNERHGLAHDIGQNVEATAMGHANDKRVRAEFRRPINGILERRDNGFSAVQSKALGRVEFLSQKRFKGIGKAESLKNVLLLFLVVALPPGILDALTNPIHLIGIPNVLQSHEIDAKRVGATHYGECRTTERPGHLRDLYI
jgi:hypothetical protein